MTDSGATSRLTPLPLTTPLVNGMTYYASQSINGHESPAAACSYRNA